MNPRYLVLALSLALLPLSGCITQDFPAAPGEFDAEVADTSQSDAGDTASDAASPDATAETCQSNRDCDEPNDNETGICTNSNTCTYTCRSNYADCDQDPSNGCEVDLTTDPANCGVCGNECSSTSANLQPICVARQCDLSDDCRSGFRDLNPAIPGCECEVQPGEDEPGDGVDSDCDGQDG